MLISRQTASRKQRRVTDSREHLFAIRYSPFATRSEEPMPVIAEPLHILFRRETIDLERVGVVASRLVHPLFRHQGLYDHLVRLQSNARRSWYVTWHDLPFFLKPEDVFAMMFLKHFPVG